MYVRAATAWALSASSSKSAGISPATTPGSQSDMVTVSTPSAVSTVKLSSESSPPAALSGSALGAGSACPPPAKSSGSISAITRQSSAAATIVLICGPPFVVDLRRAKG